MIWGYPYFTKPPFLWNLNFNPQPAASGTDQWWSMLLWSIIQRIHLLLLYPFSIIPIIKIRKGQCYYPHLLSWECVPGRDWGGFVFGFCVFFCNFGLHFVCMARSFYIVNLHISCMCFHRWIWFYSGFAFLFALISCGFYFACKSC
jgi:hypothetical protein